MNVLITGAQGYIGAQLAPRLAERGHTVTGLDTGFYHDIPFYEIEGLTEPPCVRKDIRRLETADLRGFDAVVHLAELSNDPLAELNPELTYRINHRGSVELAKLCKEAGVARFVYTSSCSVYGAGADERKTEESEVDPQTAYADCKMRVERDVGELADDDFSPTFLRNATAFGPSPRMRFDLVLNNLAGCAWTTGEIRMTSDGTPWRPLVHVLDICEAIACTLDAPRAVVHNQVLNVGGSDENYRIREVAEAVAAAFPGCSLTIGTSDGDSRSYRVSFEKIAETLPDFRCRHTLASGARELREIFEAVGLTRELFEYRAYTRLKQLKYLLATGRLDRDLHWRKRARAGGS